MSEEIVLVIDDEADILEVIELKLEKLGCKIKTALTAEDGFNLIINGDVDCILCDIILPEMTGIDLIKKCRELAINIPFIFYSGSDRDQYMQDVVQYGAFDFISKPDLDNLEEIVRKALGMKVMKSLKDKLVEFLEVKSSLEVAHKDKKLYPFLPASQQSGLAEVDQQHDTIYRILDEIEMKIIANDPLLPRTIKKLMMCLKEHQIFEEDLMVKSRYPLTNQHKEQHEHFGRMCELLIKAGNLSPDNHLMVFKKFRDYYEKHLIQYDAKAHLFFEKAIK